MQRRRHVHLIVIFRTVAFQFMTFGRKFITVLTSFIVDHFTIGDLHSFFSAFGSVAGHFKDIVQHDVGQDFKNILNNKKGQAIHPHKKDVVCWWIQIKQQQGTNQ